MNRIKNLIRTAFPARSGKSDWTPVDEHIFNDASAALQQTHNVKLRAGRTTTWRKIMESKATKYSAAATILVTASLVLFDPFGLFGGRHGVVLAEAVERMNEVTTIRHKEKRVYYEQGKDEPLLRTDVIKYVSSHHGIVEEQYDEEGNLMYRVYIRKEPQEFVLLFVREKQYLKMPIADSWARLMENLTPKGIVDHFKAGNCKELGPAEIDGHDVVGFETLDAGMFPIPGQYRFLFPIREIKWQFWIDDRSLLPIAADLEVTTGRGLFTSFKELRITCHDYDVRYDEDIPETVFDPNIPADYVPLNLESAVKDNAAWLGLGGIPIGLLLYRRRRRLARKQSVGRS